MTPHTNGLFSWRARDKHGRGAGGVTDQGERALSNLMAAMQRLSPGAVGSMERVSLDPIAISYHHGAVVVRAERHDSGVVLSEQES